ncbi:triple tyrosine motif-containing protein [Niabella hirudinis]|uniref:triple tyrosine motif-containing protein n=1 Tax=Niabella hirudinis TaxID=1285929 RepID=UPI003EBAF890
MKKLSACFFVLFPLLVAAQNIIGLPNTVNFSHKSIGAGAQTWQAAQDRFGTLYFANNSGLLSYNGKEWKLYKLPNKTIVRSLLIAADDKIYIGGQGEFGYFFPDQAGNLVYHSLVEQIRPEDRLFGDIWKIVLFENCIFFRTYNKIYRLDLRNNKVTVFSTPHQSRWDFLEAGHGLLYAKNDENGLVVFRDQQWQPLNGNDLKKSVITSMLTFGRDSLLVVTLREGIFLLRDNRLTPLPVNPLVKKAQIYTACKIDEASYAVGTVSGGVFFLDRSGALLRHFSVNNGLQNNNVLALFKDRRSALWVGLDEGIDLINYDAPLQLISPDAKVPVAAYTAAVHEGNLYIGTSDGAYFTKLSVPELADQSFSQNEFQRLGPTAGQVWSISTPANQVLIGMNDGAFMVKNGRAQLLNNGIGGTWLYRTIPGQQKVVAGTYAGIELFIPKNGGLRRDLSFKTTLKQSLRFIETDSLHHTIWASHPYRGIYRIRMDAGYEREMAVDQLTTREGLPSNNNNFVFKIDGNIVFATEQGIYEWDDSGNRFRRSARYQPVFGSLSIKFMTQDAAGRIWFATEKRMGVAVHNKVHYFSELDGQLIAGFENIYPFNDRNIFINSYKGILHLNYEQYLREQPGIAVLLSKVQTIGQNDSVLFNGYFMLKGRPAARQDTEQFLKLLPRYRSVHFEFAADDYAYADKTQYSYQLKGFDETASLWSSKTDKDYTNLPYGRYTFEVRAMDHRGRISAPVAYTFEILPRWYQTWLAYSSYLLLLLLLFFLVHKIYQRRLRKQQQVYEYEQEQLRYIHELERDRSDKQIIQLQKERLETEVMYKNKELATTTMHLYKRGRLLGKIKEEVSDGIKKISNHEEKKGFNKLLKLIMEEEKKESDWNQFSIHFDQVHNNFLHKIKAAYPLLTPSDMKICAYVKMNLSSKEIAQLLNITLKGVEIARYRLRKKFGLPQEVPLSGFIQEFS